MLDDLVKIKKITIEQYQTYNLFVISETGRNWLSRMLIETFMSQAMPDMMTGEVLAHLEGRRSIIREIKMDIEHVEQKLAEENYVR